MVLEKSALSAVEAAADAVIGEHYFGDHHSWQCGDDKSDDDSDNNDDIDIGGHDKRWPLCSGMIEGEESFQDAANSVMEAAGAIAGQHFDKYPKSFEKILVLEPS